MACVTCRYWSDMSKRAVQGENAPRGKEEALCLNVSSPSAHKYTVESDTCDFYKRAGG